MGLHDNHYEIVQAVRRGSLAPGTYLEPAVVVERGKLHSVWATEEPGEARVPRVAGRVEHQGGFPQQRHGRCYIVVIDVGAANDLVTLAAACRWCGGDGLHPFLSERWRQVLNQNVQLDRSSAVALHAWIVKNVSGQDYLARPLSRFMFDCAKQGIDALAIHGLQLEDVACPRCSGHGASRWIDSGVEVEPLAVLQSTATSGCKTGPQLVTALGELHGRVGVES